MARKQKQGRGLQVGTYAEEEVVRAGVPDAVTVHRKAKFYRAVVWATVFLCPFALLAMIGIATTPHQKAVDSGAATSPGRAVATSAMLTWLAQSPPPLIGGEILSWDGATSLGMEKRPANGAKTPPRSLEIDHFSLIDAQSNLYTSDIEIAYDSRGGAVALGGPSLVPIPPPATDSWSTGSTWPKLVSANITPPITQAVTAWAQAYTSGNPDDLRLAVGDPTETDYYVPLVGATVQSITATGAAKTSLTGSTLVVRVELSVSWTLSKDNSTAASTTTTTVASNITYPIIYLDLLVERANTASPVVTAWGGPGTGPTLVRYGNAVVSERDLLATPTSTTTTTTIPVPTTALGN